MKKRTNEKEVEEDDCGPPTEKPEKYNSKVPQKILSDLIHQVVS